jgi:hypothetical protein
MLENLSDSATLLPPERIRKVDEVEVNLEKN